jgi:hypothetical protein
MNRAGLLLAVWVSGASAAARADGEPPQPDAVPTARPVIPIDDTRSHGPTARDWLDLSIAPAVLAAPDSVFATTVQLAAGLPSFDVREARELSDHYHLSDYQLRARGELFHEGDDWLAGPLTLALQRYFPVAPLAISPLVYAHFGVETAISTPWLSGRHVTPPEAVRVLRGVDTELLRDGWSLRPAAVYFRGDFLACRSWSLEVGGSPEFFFPTDGATEYDVRFHGAAGVSLGCHGNMSPRAPKLSLEYRGRARAYASDQDPGYNDALGAALQIDLAWFVAQLFYAADPGSTMRQFGAFGVRLQVGSEK